MLETFAPKGIISGQDKIKLIFCLSSELLAKVRNLPFDSLRVNGLRLKLFSFSVRGKLVEPQKNTFARASQRASKDLTFIGESV